MIKWTESPTKYFVEPQYFFGDRGLICFARRLDKSVFEK